VSVVGRFVAELRGEEVATLRAATSANSARLFNLAAR
jgi:Tat protein secretion system quality control protein TatD with DNase activity